MGDVAGIFKGGKLGKTESHLMDYFTAEAFVYICCTDRNHSTAGQLLLVLIRHLIRCVERPMYQIIPHKYEVETEPPGAKA